MTPPAIRYRKIDCGIGKHVPISIVSEIFKKRATHVSLHANNIHSLDLCLPQHRHQRKNKEDESIRTGEFSLQHLLELDLSSNCLHEGYALTRLHVPEKVSLLGLCSNYLLTLNLASNGLNEQSFGNMIEMCSGGVEKSCFLARLRTLDISHNRFTVLPQKLHDLCPSLKHLAAVNNKIKSLTTLLKELHTLRGQLESLQLIDDTTKSTTNLVCSKELYQEKIIFLLGTQFVRLDGCNINNNARENARLKLEHGLVIHPRFFAGVTKAKDRTRSVSCENDCMEQRARLEFNDHGEDDGREMHEKIKSLEGQVTSLSATIESYVTSSKSCVASRCRNETGQVFDSNEAKLCTVDKPESQHSYMRQREKAAARFLFIVVSRKRNKAPLYMAFSLWLVSTRFDRYIQRSKVRQGESEMKWIQQTKESVDQAVKDEAEKSKRNIDHFRVVIQESEESISRLTCEVEDLEKRLQNEKRNQRKYEVVFSETSEEMKNDMHRLEAELRKQISENKEYARDSETELNKLHEKLQWLSELLPDERRSRAEVESKNKDLKIAYDEAKSRLAEDAALLKQIKLEVVSKEETIQSVKAAYEHAAKRSASDRSRCEQAVAAEQKAKDLLHRQTIMLRNVEAETCRYVADHQSKYSCKLSSLSREVEEKDQRLNASALRIKSILEEQDDLRTQLMECKKIKSHAEEKNMYLEAQLNRAADAMLKAKESSINKEQFVEAQSQIRDLKHALDMLRRSSQQREQNLLTKNREDAEMHERMTKDLSRKMQLAKREWVARVKQNESTCRLEIQELTDAKQRELASADEKFKVERQVRLALEEKVAKLQSELAIQKLKMQTAIDSMVNKLSET